MTLGYADEAETNAIYDYYKPHIALSGDVARNRSRAAKVDENLERVMGMHVIHQADGSFSVQDSPPLPKSVRDREPTEAETIIGERIVRLPDGSIDTFPDA